MIVLLCHGVLEPTHRAGAECAIPTQGQLAELAAVADPASGGASDPGELARVTGYLAAFLFAFTAAFRLVRRGSFEPRLLISPRSVARILPATGNPYPRGPSLPLLRVLRL